MKLEGRSILVVGGATGGALSALFFAHAGARITLLERVGAPRAIGAGIAIAENGMAVLESLGLRDAIEKVARAVGAARVVDSRGRTLFAPRADSMRGWMLRRSELQSILLDAVMAESRVDARFGYEVLSASPDGTVVVREGSGARELHAELIVAADGAHSRIRQGGRFGAQVDASGIEYLRTIVAADVAREEEAWTAAGLFGSFALRRGTYVYASAGSRECRAAVASQDLARLRSAWAAAYPPAREILSSVRAWDELIFNRVVRVRCRTWIDGRIVLLGDAAHAMAPNLGQGANSAAVDASVLVDELLRAKDLEAGLLAYEQRRKPAVTKVARAAARLGALAEVTHPMGRLLRDRVLMPLLSRTPGGIDARMILQERPEELAAARGARRSDREAAATRSESRD
ncbi:MAG: NAD(P)/FAD-dependent oxidoreductase [Candidatus Eisenbacteria bacterium]